MKFLHQEFYQNLKVRKKHQKVYIPGLTNESVDFPYLQLSFKVCKGVYEFNFRNPLLENVLFARLRRRFNSFDFSNCFLCFCRIKLNLYCMFDFLRLRTLGFSKQRVLGDGNCTVSII